MPVSCEPVAPGPRLRHQPPGQWWRLALATLLAGLAAGLIGIAMHVLLELFESVFYGVSQGSLPERVSTAPAWRRVAAPALGGALAGCLWWWERRTGGVRGVEEAVADPTLASASRMGILRPFADALIQVLTVGSGSSVGREGAPRLAAGAVASRLVTRLRVDPTWGRVLIASAAGAGLASMYNAPLGGAAYAVEIVMGSSLRRRGAVLAVLVSLLATVVSWMSSHGSAAVEIPGTQASWATSAGTVLVLPAALIVALATRSLWAWVKRHRLPDTWSLPLAISGAGLLTGTASLWLPVLPGNGRDAFQAALLSPSTAAVLVTLLGVIVLKPVLTAATLGAGATGGLLAPSFALGASTGAALGVTMNLAGWEVSTAALALVGGGVVLAVTQRAPVFGAVFVWELTHAPAWTLLVLLAATFLSTSVTRLADRRTSQQAPHNT